jgi:hypothetical protein
MCSKLAAFIDLVLPSMISGVGMIPEEVPPPEPVPSDKSEGTQPQGMPDEDPDKVRGEVFKRMFPDHPKKSPA